MTDEEVAEIKSRVTHAQTSLATGINDDVSAWFHVKAYADDGAALLAEVEQWRAIGRRYVGYGVVEPTITDSTGATLTYQQCEWCLKQARIGDPFIHAPDCLAEQARILLGMQEVKP